MAEFPTPDGTGVLAGVMRETGMTVTTGDGLALAGTLTVPAGPGPHPAVLLLPGSGRLDRDSNAGRLRMDLGRPLAAALAKHGIASLRYDRRGVGASPGDWLSTGFADNYDDAATALRALAARPEVRTDATGAVGHSEGAVHAMRLGATGNATAVVLLAAFARPAEDALKWQILQLADNLPRPLRPFLVRFAYRKLERIKTTSTDVARVSGVRVNAHWFREILAHDPRRHLRAIRVPVLAITGDKDVQVDPGDLDTIARLVPGEVDVRRIPGLTHVLRRDSGPASVRSYRRLLRQPVDPEILDDVAEWLSGRLG
jgi:pimeloyl-ACP methyl ester carboxylesterase